MSWKAAPENDSDLDTISDSFVLLDEHQGLPIRTHDRIQENVASLSVTPVLSRDAFIVSVNTPRQPAQGLVRASCDIVLVIDVSVSMADPAPLPDAQNNKNAEETGLSILDLTKHAARTILSTLKDEDRLGIVAYSNDAQIVEELTFMTADAKASTWKKIEDLCVIGSTNLWSGIRTGWSLFEKSKTAGNVQGMFVLTDGMPNYMCPKQGYAVKLKEMLAKSAVNRPCAPTIHTFGFGYFMRSELMTTIAEVGNGSYAFIPDAGMIGTVFVHAVANMFSTFGTCAVLELKCQNKSTSRTITLRGPSGYGSNTRHETLLIKLGNIQYGQSRDIWIQCQQLPKNSELVAELRYNLPNEKQQVIRSRFNFSDRLEAPQDWVEYHGFRAELCEFLSSLFPHKENGERGLDKNGSTSSSKTNARLQSLIGDIKSCRDKGEGVQSLIAELIGEEPAGQISLALKSTRQEDYWNKWGRHYLPSLMHAHQRQVCNTFKDPGPLLYGKNSPLFVQCRDQLDAAFDNLPAPKPSLPPAMVRTVDHNGKVVMKPGRAYTVVSMSKYNSSSNACFEGNCKVKMADGSHVAVKRLRSGMSVWTPVGNRRVAAIVRTRINNNNNTRTQKLCRVGELLVTPWHPIKYEGRWRFPVEVADITKPYSGDVYSVLLTASAHADAHAIEVGGQTCVTLGHGIIRDGDDVRAHAFFGNYTKVTRSISQLRMDKNGHRVCVGLERARRDGHACGFLGSRSSTQSALKVGRLRRGSHPVQRPKGVK